METITFKIQEEIVKKIDGLLTPLHFNNRTEFIREALREKLRDLEKDKAINLLEKFKGLSNKTVSDKRLEEIREQVGKEYAKKFGIKLD